MHSKLTQAAIAAVALLAIASGSGAHAQAVITQAKALAGSVTPGDTAGFPITLSVPGAYKLTGNLVVPAGVGGIYITAPGVTLDLNGFNISGPGTCTRDGSTYVVTCSDMAVVTHGVWSKSGGSTVRNGQVRGFYTGVWSTGNDRIEDLLVEQNHGFGVSNGDATGLRSTIRNVRSQLNGASGFSLSDTAVQGSTASNNGQDGFGPYNNGRNVVLDSVAFGNKGAGLTGPNMVVGRSVAQDNKVANVFSVKSLGGNLNGTTPF